MPMRSFIRPFSHPFSRLAPLCLGALLASSAALAQQAAAPTNTQAHLPAQQTSGALRYQCGGIGTDESTAMRAAMGRYPLSLLFARADGAYEADVGVRITAQGASAQTMTFNAAGPVCLLQLPAGSYRVEVQGAGQSHARTVQIGGAPKTLDFRF